jgi:hypothetical protein
MDIVTMSDDPDRPNALLTDAQRRYLRDGDDVSPEYARKLRGDIRERIRNSLLDFTLLMWRLEDRDREQIFGPLRETPDGEGYEHQGTGHRVGTFEQGELLDGLHNALGFLYRAAEDAGLPFEQFLRTAIERSLPPGPAYDVTVDIDVDREERPDVDTARAVMSEGGRLTDAEFRVLVEHSGVNTREVVEHSKRKEGEEPETVEFTEGDVEMRGEVPEPFEGLREWREERTEAFRERCEDDGEGEADGEDGPDAEAE